ncbi:hypothetical protein BDW42DRAFT_143886 [Aspergillus taichungensis]|uniref:Uncharacterized protein n=1 Tax=Aspergillus taichungensis TaxID=482145 RepID=A0A2J5HMK3_9EURO|nr:hypothetical protein BDW42DRAFT_143886 [Aspergillus taichungensis]
MGSKTVKMQSHSPSVLKTLDCNSRSLSHHPTPSTSPSSPNQKSCLSEEEHKPAVPYCSDAQDSDPCQAGHDNDPDQVVSGKGTVRSPFVEIPFPSSNLDLLAELTDSDFLFDGPEMPLNPQNTPEGGGGKVSPLFSNRSRDKAYQSSPLAEPTALAWLTDIFENYDNSIVQDGSVLLSSEPYKPTLLSSTEAVASNSPENNRPGPAAQPSQDTSQPCRQLSSLCQTMPMSSSKPKSTHIPSRDQPESSHEIEYITADKPKKPLNNIQLNRRRYVARTLRRTSLKSLRTSKDYTSRDPDLCSYRTTEPPPNLRSEPCHANVPGFVWYGRLWSATYSPPRGTRAMRGSTDGMATSETFKQIGRSYLPLLEELERSPLFGWSFYHCQVWISLSHGEDAADHRAQNTGTHKYQINLNVPALLLYVFVLIMITNLYIFSLSFFSRALDRAHRLLSRFTDMVLQELETLRTDTSTLRLPPPVTDWLSCLQSNHRVDLGFELKRVH